MNDQERKLKIMCMDGLALAELVVAFTNKKSLSEHLRIFLETNEALLILNSAESLIERAKGVELK